jgi:selenocysteine lyase/cysteine desulfurase
VAGHPGQRAGRDARDVGADVGHHRLAGGLARRGGLGTCRTAGTGRLARYLGVPEAHVALMGSAAEAAATVAASLPGRGGSVVVGDSEFRSNLFPWLALEARGYRIVRVPVGGAGRTGSLLAAIDEQTVLIAVSHVLSADGERTDLGRLRAAADSVGARIFADDMQSLGVLSVGLAASLPDYLAVHGYKWLLCPRGAAWLVTRHYGELRPLMPSWKSAADGGYFGGSLRLAAGAPAATHHPPGCPGSARRRPSRCCRRCPRQRSSGTVLPLPQPSGKERWTLVPGQ